MKKTKERDIGERFEAERKSHRADSMARRKGLGAEILTEEEGNL